MAIYKCKMCGGSLNITEDSTVCECEYCGSVQTVPILDNEKKINLFSRANRLLGMSEFDKAAGVYESIISEFPEEAEAYWDFLLCRLGIEYVDDPKTGNKVPTCHRASFDSIMEDSDFDLVMEYSDAASRAVYREQAKEIERLRAGIIEVSAKEAPYDIFICYKETDENGDRTVDSVIAQDVYTALTEKGYRVFFSRISLEDKLGEEYEPYIFAALNSAKIMLAFGTDYEYYNAVWVKNEWSRFLSLIEHGAKKTLIPCYKNIDAYDMPKEFARLQAQDMGKVGAVQDLLRGVEKILGGEKTAESAQQSAAPTASGSNVDALLKRVDLFLEDGDWEKADEYCERVLDEDPENAQAYVKKLLSELNIKSLEELTRFIGSLDGYSNYNKAMKFADNDLKNILKSSNEVCTNALLEQGKAHSSSLISASRNAHKIVAVNSDGSVLAAGDNKYGQCNVSDWKNVVAVSAGGTHTIALKSDGTVYAIGDNKYGQCNVSDWKNVVAISTGKNHTIALKSDGTVYAIGDNKYGQCNVSSWKNIVMISAGGTHTVALKSDNSVLATGTNSYGQCDVANLRGVVAVSAGDCFTVALKSDNSVLAIGTNSYGQCNVSGWKNIVMISAGGTHTVGLKSDGSLLATGWNSNGQCNVSNWKGVIAISAGGLHTVGLKSDGTVLVGESGNKSYKSVISSWRLFPNIFTIDEKEIVNSKSDTRKTPLLQEQNTLKKELAGLGRFSGKRKKEITDRIAEINQQIERIEKS